MIFTTPWFLIFTLFTLVAILLLVKWRSARRWLLLLSSLIFYYHFSGLPSLVFVCVLAAAVYVGAIVAADDPKRRNVFFVILALPIATLIYFRYTGMLSETFSSLLPSSVSTTAAVYFGAAGASFVPLGISFFAFEFCHYIVDVMKGAQPIRNPLHFAIFSFFYPRMAAGPVIRFQNIVPQIQEMAVPRSEDVTYGLQRIIFGFIKKFLVADPVASLIAFRYQTDAIICGADVVYLCLLLYIRIYMDFSGYSDMAIGLARLWGIRVPENFNFPFIATSPSAFWRRWHISLSTWIRDYVYVPLGGARGSQVRRAINLALAMALCGIWHGSAWHFVLWGLFHGALLTSGHFLKQAIDDIVNYRLTVAHIITKKTLKIAMRLSRVSVLAASAAPPLAARLARLTNRPPANHPIIGAVRTALGWVTTQICVVFSWLLFFYPMPDVLKILRVLPIAPVLPVIF